MADKSFTYAVSRIRALEVKLLNRPFLDSLVSAPTYKDCMDLLAEKGWGNGEAGETAEKVLEGQEEDIWKTMGELGIGKDVFSVLFIPREFHNLKAAVKKICIDAPEDVAIYNEGTYTEPKVIEDALREKNYTALPQGMRECAKEAFESLLHNRDGQVCDCIIDKACLDEITKAAAESDVPVIKEYAESVVAVADIKIAVRGCRAGKSREFLKRALSPCKTIYTEGLINAAVSGLDQLYDFLTQSGYGEAVEALKKSPSVFEKWCDDQIIRAISPEKYHTFTAGPLVAYVLARQNEIKTVRIVLTCRENNIPADEITGRLREMYV
ncbi:MAG: V-type ATPase subunit [Lachnospiraceae bacterium]|nr:V-type ATPase subunit [Lachnospiraceae bacterium]